MMFGIILIVFASILTVYVFFSAARFLNKLKDKKKHQEDLRQDLFTNYFTKITLVIAFGWWFSLILARLFHLYCEAPNECHWLISSSTFLMLCILSILGLLMYRNHAYHDYFSDQMVNTFLYEYALSFINGILFASIIAYTVEIIVMLL